MNGLNSKTVAYVRISREDDIKNKESESITNQIEYIKEYAKNHQLMINKNYIDDGYTGIHFERPGFAKMLEDIEEGKISVVITKDFSRLGREYIDTVYYITRYFPEKNIRYIAINENFDSKDENTQIKDILVEIKSVINDKFIKDTSMKIKKIKDIKTQKGFYMGFIAPYGYRKIKKDDKITLEIDHDASKIVERIFKEIANGISKKEVSKKLNEDGVLPPIKYLNMTKSRNKDYKEKWTDKIIYRIIRNQVYIGNNVIRKSIKIDYKMSKRDYIPIKERQIITNTHPAIIVKDLFQKANENIKSRKRKVNRIKDYDNVLNELIVCGECKNKMKISGRLRESGNVHFSFYCGNYRKKGNCGNNRKISDHVLKNIIYKNLTQIIQEFVNQDNIVNTVTQNLIKKRNTSRKVEEIKSNIQLYDINIKKLYLQKASGSITLEQFMEGQNIQNNMKKQQESLLEELPNKNNIEQIVEKYSEFLSDKEIYKFALRKLVKEVIVYKDGRIEIRFNFKCKA